MSQAVLGTHTLNTTLKIIEGRAGHGILYAARHQKIHLDHLSGAVAFANNLTSATTIVKLFLARTNINPDDTTDPNTHAEMTDNAIIWAHVMHHVVAGTPVNTFRTESGVPISVDLKGRLGSSLIHHETRPTTNIHGFGFLAVSSISTTDILAELVLEYRREYLDSTGPSPDYNITIIEEEETGDDF